MNQLIRSRNLITLIVSATALVHSETPSQSNGNHSIPAASTGTQLPIDNLPNATPRIRGKISLTSWPNFFKAQRRLELGSGQKAFSPGSFLFPFQTCSHKGQPNREKKEFSI